MIELNLTRRTPGLILLVLAASLGALAQEAEPPADADADAAPEYGLSGRVTDPDGAAVGEVTVWVRLEQHKPASKTALGDDWIGPVSTTTDETGEFHVTMPADGPYVVFMIHPDHPPVALDGPVDSGTSIDFSFPPAIEHSGRVRDADGTPIAGADVVACAQQAPTFGADACELARTDERGEYAFTRLAEGSYGFQAWAPGYALSVLEPGRFPLDPDGEAVAPLVLEPGAEVTGTLTDDSGAALAGVQVHYATDRVRLRQARGERDAQPLILLFTDEQGQFSFRGLPAGEPLKLFANVTKNRPAESKTLTLEAGAVVGGVEIVYERPATVTVRLVDSDDQPIGALEVLWLPVKANAKSSGAGFRMAGYAGSSEVEAQGEGRFRITRIKPQRYNLTLLPSGYREIVIEDLNVSPGASIDLGTRVARPGVTLSGYVRDDLGDPVDQARVEAMYLEKGTAMSRSARSAADGRFVVGGLSDQPLLWLKVEAEGHAPSLERGVAASRSDLEIVLERVGVVAGRVVLDDGDTARGVEAALVQGAGGQLVFRPGNRTSAKGDAEGHFEIKDAAPGKHELRLTAKGAKPLLVKDVVVEAGVTTDVGTYRLEPGQELGGRVLDAGDGSPVVGAAISADAASSGLGGKALNFGTTTTDDEGHFVVDGLEPGRLILTVEHAGYAGEKVETLVREDEPTEELTIHLGQGGTLRGTVRDESGQPSPNRALGLIEGGGYSPDGNTVRTNEAGEYRMERVRPGTYRVLLYPDPSANAMNIRQKSATIRNDVETVVDFDNEAKIAFEGYLTRAGRPVGEVTVMLIPAGGGGAMQTRTASTDVGGRFELGLTHGGEYNVVVQDLKQGFGSLVGQTSIVVPDEPTVSMEVELQAGTILGTILDAEGNPIEGAVVSAVLDDARAGEIGAGTGARAEADGSFRIEGANAGTYTVTAIAEGYELATRSVTLTASSVVEGVDFRLELAGHLHGRVVDAEGNGIPGALVFATLPGAPGATTLPSETDGTGFFRLSAPSDGPCDLEAVARGFAPGALRGFAPPPDPEAPGARITLTPGASIVVRVVDASGTGVDGAQPVVQPETPSQAFTIARLFAPVPPTDASGTSRILALAPGTYLVSVAGRPELGPMRIGVGGDGEAQVTLQLP